MSKVKIQILDPDGKFRGRQRSSKIPSPSWALRNEAVGPHDEVMACDGDPLAGTWLLFALEDSDGKALSCREQTPAQALAWFLTNGVEPPDHLIVRARRYWADWMHVRNVPEATAAFTALAQPKANAGGTASPPSSDDELATLRRLGLISCDDTLPPRATELVREMGLGQLSKWMDAQVMNIADWLKQNVGFQVAPNTDASGPTTFSITNGWLQSWDVWVTKSDWSSEPSSVEQHANALAAATKAALPVLRRFGEPTDAAERLIMGLEGATPNRTQRMDQTAAIVKHQMIDIGGHISCGALSGDEDLRERRAEWQDLLSEFKTQEARDAFQRAFDADLARPRDAVHHTQLLDLARDRRQLEERTIPLDAILATPVTDAASQCQRWQALVAYGRRFGAMAGASLRITWAGELKRATEALHPHAEAIGLSADACLSISALEHQIDRLLAGEELDLRPVIEDAQPLVQAIVTKSRSRKVNRKVDSWAPSVHQEIVLKVLQRDGRLHTAELWKRVDPKWVELRAHQQAMRELVKKERVGKSGKARSIEYWAL